jgi:hypothetical protein
MSDLFTFDSLNQQFQELNKLTQNEQETEKEAGKLTEGTSILPVLPIVSELYGKGVQVAGKLQQAYTQFQKVGQAADAARAKAFNLAKQVRQQPTAEEEQAPVEEQPFTASVNEGGVELTDLSSLGRTVQGGLDAGIGSETSLESPLSSVVSDTLGTLRSGVSSAVSDTVGTLRSTVGSIVQPETDISTLNSLLPSGAGSYVDLSGTAQGLQDVARSALSDAQGSLRTGMSAIQGVGEDALTSLQQTAQGALSSAQQAAQGALSSVQETGAAVASGLEGAAADASSAVGALTSGGLGGITSGAAADAVAGLGSAATSAIGTAGSGLQSAVGTLGSAIGVDTSAVSGAIGSAVQAGTAAVETGTAVATGVLSTVGEVLGPIGALASIAMGIYDIFSASENHHIDAVAAPTFTAGL